MNKFMEIENRVREADKGAALTKIDHVKLETQPIPIPKMTLLEFDDYSMKCFFSSLAIKQSFPDIQKVWYLNNI